MAWITDTGAGVAVLGLICFVAALVLFIVIIVICCKCICNDPDEDKKNEDDDPDNDCCCVVRRNRPIVTPIKNQQYDQRPMPVPQQKAVQKPVTNKYNKPNVPVISIESVEEGTQTTTPGRGPNNWSVARERVIRTDMTEKHPEPFAISGFWDHQREQKGIPYKEWVEEPPGSPMYKPETPSDSVFDRGTVPLKTPMSLKSGTIPSLPPSTAGRSYYSTNKILKG